MRRVIWESCAWLFLRRWGGLPEMVSQTTAGPIRSRCRRGSGENGAGERRGAGLLPPTALLPHTTLPQGLGSDEYAHDFAVDWPQQAYQSGGGEFLQLEIRRQTDAQADHRPRAERDHIF